MIQPHMAYKAKVLALALTHRSQFTPKFLAYLPDNIHVMHAFEREALMVVRRGFEHYSARTIVEALRHESALAEASPSPYKLNDWHTPYLARMFALLNPQHRTLFEFRLAKAPGKQREAANDSSMSHHVTPAAGASR